MSLIGRCSSWLTQQLVVTQIAPLFSDDFEAPGLLTGRAGWTAAGDVTRRNKMTAADGIARMTGGSNGSSPAGHQLTPAPTQYRRITFDYDYSQQGGTPSNPATPYQFFDQHWIVAYLDVDNYTYLMPVSPSAGFMQLRVYKRVAGVETELTCRFLNVPWAGTAKIELTDRIRLYINGQIRVADQLFNAVTSAFPDRLFAAGTTAIRTGETGLKNSFHNLCLAKNWKVESLDMRVADPKEFYGRNTTTNSRIITFSGTYEGSPVSWAYRLRRRTTEAVVKGWTAFTPTAGSGAWSAAIDVATGGAYLADFAWIGADGFARIATASPFAVGILAICNGQSNAVNQSGIGGTPGYGGNDFIYGYMNNAAYTNSSWERWHGELTPESLALQPNMVGLAKSLSDATGIPVGVAAIGFASNALANLKPGTANWTAFEAFVAKIGGYYEVVVWSQAEAEGLSSSSYSNYVPDHASLVAGFKTAGGNTDVHVFNRIIGKDTAVANNSTTTLRASSVRALLNNLENGVDVWTGCSSLGLLLVDNIHFATVSSVAWAYRMGLTIARRKYGVINYDGRGPLVTGASRSGSVITLTVDLNGTSGITGTALTAYEISNDDFATVLPQSSATVTANQIVITLSSTPTGIPKLRSFAQPNYDDSSLATGTLPGAVTVPVFPILTPITVT